MRYGQVVYSRCARNPEPACLQRFSEPGETRVCSKIHAMHDEKGAYTQPLESRHCPMLCWTLVRPFF
eukprot:5184536-Amphidinium_carterae.5